MKKIPLSKGKFALVDDADFDWLNQWKWSYQEGYACSNQRRKNVKMHRLITDANDGVEVDHIDMDGLNNQRNNLRNVTKSQNCMNRKSYAGSVSRFKGVYFHGKNRKWCSQITINGKQKYLGQFLSEEDAAQAYNFSAIKEFGVYARLNLSHG